MSEGEKKITLPNKVALVKPSDGKNVQTQPTYRTIAQPMRLVVPPGIIQTQSMAPAMIKQVDNSGRAQIVPARSLTQTSITVTRSPTPTSFVPRATNVTGPRGTTVMNNPRTPTPPTANITTSFVRSAGNSRTPSPAATVISPGTTWMSAVPAMHTAQIIRASINPSPRPQGRVITQQNPITTSTGNATITSNVVQQTNQGQQIQPQQVSQSQQQAQTAQLQQSAAGGQILATLATVQCPPRQQTATLVYSNVSTANQPQQFTASGQRLTLTAPRQARPIQLTTNNRLTGTGIRIRPPAHVLASANVLTAAIPTNATVQQQPQGQVQAVGQQAQNQQRTGPANITTTRIIQVQPQRNLMTLTPVLMNATGTAAGGNRVTTTPMAAGKMQPSLTITQVGKITQQQGQGNAGNHNLSVVSQSSQPGQQAIAQIVSVGQQPTTLTTNQGHQIVTVNQQQIIAQSAQNVSTTMLPLSAITSRPPSISAQQGIVRTVSTPTQQPTPTVSGIITSATPIAKVIPQQQQQSNQPGQIQIEGQSSSGIFIHSKSPNPTTVSVNPNTSGILTLATSSAPITNIIPAVSYTAASSIGPGSFAVVTANRSTPIGQIQGIVPVPSTIGTVVVTNTTNTIATSHGSAIVSQPLQMISVATSSGIQGQPQQVQQQLQQPQHVLIPVSSKLATATTSPRPSILRKRDNEGVLTSMAGTSAAASNQSPVKGVKNLVPIFHAMGDFNLNVVTAPSAKMELIAKDRTMFVSPPANSPDSDGSTTVSATSSPGVDKQQEEEEAASISLSMKLQSEMKKISDQNALKNADRDDGPSKETPLRKKARKNLLNESESGKAASTGILAVNNKENAQQTTSSASSTSNEMAVKKPRSCSLLECYKQSWKAAHNHFQRYSDVKPREEKRPTIIDLANQSHVLQKVNGWKVYHLSAQMEDLVDMESQIYDKLSMMLQCMEAHDQNSDVDRVNDLLKGNMQRSKVIIDGINDGRNQIMKIFDHKSQVSDIIHRCQSKRNFKKREKM